MQPQRIMIIGYSGSGKSTLAGICAARYGLPVLYLDTIQFLPDWVVRDREEFRALLAEFLKNESWVIDGTYSRFFYEERMERADRIYFLDFNRFSCLYRAWKRYRTYRGTQRESMAAGCNEKLDWEFIRWILWDTRTKAQRKKFMQVVERYPQKVTVIRNQRQLTREIRKIHGNG